MFGSKKAVKPSRGTGARPKNDNLANMMAPVGPDDDDDDDSLLAELAALEGRPRAAKKAQPKKAHVSMDEIGRMAAAGMRDVEDDNDDDDDFDESDLLAELNELASDEEGGDEEEEETEKPSATSSSNHQNLLLERKEMYKVAIAEAKEEGATSKVRRYDRGLKEIETLLKKVAKGGSVKEDEIPPVVAVKVSKPINPQTQTLPGPPVNKKAIPETPVERFSAPTPTPPLIPQPVQPQQSQPKQLQPVQLRPQQPQLPQQSAHEPISNEKLELLLNRQKQFKILALNLKKQGDIDGARKNLGISKQFDSVIAAVKEGKNIDLSNMPQLPSASSEPQASIIPKQDIVTAAPPQTENNAAASSAPPPGPPPVPTTAMEALQQRLERYQESTNQAKFEGNSGKSRRMGRIVKQYQDAIKCLKANKTFDFNELPPPPPGYAPIPGFKPQTDDVMDDIQTSPAATAPLPPKPVAATSPTASASVTLSRNEKEYSFLVTRQKEFKMAALEAKKAGDVESAREYLRQSKGLDQMIIAAQNGMRVDVTTVPSLKKKEDSVKSANSIGTEGVKEAVSLSGSNAQNYVQIESALKKQIETAEKNSQHYKLLGNLDAAKNFESLFTSSKKDLNTLLQYKSQNSPVPKCNYLTKTFPVVRSNPHLSDSELEITVSRCINVPIPSGYQAKDMYCYVVYDFQYPQERPQTGHTTTKKETINPEYDECFKVTIDRKQSSFKRFCRRHGVNVKVFHTRGFLKSDKALGQANIKLTSFSNKCEIHECVDLLDVEKGRKAVGGKIEILLKIREPFEDKDTEIVKEKWLVLDTHLRNLDLKTPSQPNSKKATTYESLEVLKSEKDLLERQLIAYKATGKQAPPSISEKIKSHEQKMQQIQIKFKEGGKPAIVNYLKNLLTGLEVEKFEASNALRRDDKQAAKNCLVKKKLLEKEIGVLKQRLGL